MTTSSTGGTRRSGSTPEPPPPPADQFQRPIRKKKRCLCIAATPRQPVSRHRQPRRTSPAGPCSAALHSRPAASPASRRSLRAHRGLRLKLTGAGRGSIGQRLARHRRAPARVDKERGLRRQLPGRLPGLLPQPRDRRRHPLRRPDRIGHPHPRVGQGARGHQRPGNHQRGGGPGSQPCRRGRRLPDQPRVHHVPGIQSHQDPRGPHREEDRRRIGGRADMAGVPQGQQHPGQQG